MKDDAPEGPSQRIQFDDAIRPVPQRVSVGVQTPDPKGSVLSERVSERTSEKTHDIDDEEKARQIADEDLNKKRKQVSGNSCGVSLF